MKLIEKAENQLINMKANYTRTKVGYHLEALNQYNKTIFENSKNITEMQPNTPIDEINQKLGNIQTAALRLSMEISLTQITFNTYKTYNIERMITSKLTEIESISEKYRGKPNILPAIIPRGTVKKDTDEIEYLRLSIGQEIDSQFIELTKDTQHWTSQQSADP